MLDWSDRSTCVLFGDGAGAVVLRADAETGILSTHLHADGSKKDLLRCPVGVSAGFSENEPNAGVRIQMAGNDVFKHAVKALDSVVDEALEANGLDKGDLDWLIPHQANLRIIEATAKRLAMPMERVIVTVDRHGNTSAGSVPLALDEAVRSGRVQRGQLLLLNISSHTTRPIMTFSAPPSSDGMTNSPTQGINTSIAPATMPERLSGTVMSQKAFQALAPRSCAASSRRTSIFTRLAYSGRIMKGQYTYVMPTSIDTSV